MATQRIKANTFSVFAVFIFLAGLAAAAEPAKDIKTGTIAGRLAMQGKGPLMDGTVLFYNAVSGPPPSAGKYWRVPTDAVKVDINARFSANLPEGKYYIGAVDKPLDESFVPLNEGELFFISQDKRGKPRLYKVKKDQIVDVDVILATPYHTMTQVTKGMTSIQGTIRDEKGEPVAGMAVFAYAKSSMTERPLFVSARSDNEGRYLLRVSGSGSYYVRARKNYEGAPSPDELMGVYKNGKSVTVKNAATKKNIDIVVRNAGVAPSQP